MRIPSRPCCGVPYGKSCLPTCYTQASPRAMKKLTRQQISDAIAAEAPEVPLTMSFFLASELVKECRRQGLRTMSDTGPNHMVTVSLDYDDAKADKKAS